MTRFASPAESDLAAYTPRKRDRRQALGDLLTALTRALDRWARRRDDRRRLVLGGFLGAVVAVLVAPGIREVRFRHREYRTRHRQ